MVRLVTTFALAAALFLGASSASAAVPAAAQMKNPKTGSPLSGNEGSVSTHARGYQAFGGKGVRSVFDPNEPKTDKTRTRSVGVAKGIKVDTAGLVTAQRGLFYSKGTRVWDSAAGRHKRVQRTVTVGSWSRVFESKTKNLKK